MQNPVRAIMLAGLLLTASQAGDCHSAKSVKAAAECLETKIESLKVQYELQINTLEKRLESLENNNSRLERRMRDLEKTNFL